MQLTLLNSSCSLAVPQVLACYKHWLLLTSENILLNRQTRTTHAQIDFHIVVTDQGVQVGQ